MGAYDFGSYRYTRPRMGILPDDPETATRDEIRVNQAVQHIQLRLAAEGFDPRRTDGVFGFFTGRAAKQYQESVGLTADGAVGSRTLKPLLRHTIVVAAQRHEVPKEYIAGVVQHESGFDPAATHLNDETTSAPGTTDRGLVQINDVSHAEVSDWEAFDARFACNWEAVQMKRQHDAYVNQGASEQRAWDAAIMYNLSPSTANDYAKGGDATEKALKFVDDVKAMGKAYFA